MPTGQTEIKVPMSGRHAAPVTTLCSVCTSVGPKTQQRRQGRPCEKPKRRLSLSNWLDVYAQTILRLQAASTGFSSPRAIKKAAQKRGQFDREEAPVGTEATTDAAPNSPQKVN